MATDFKKYLSAEPTDFGKYLNDEPTDFSKYIMPPAVPVGERTFTPAPPPVQPQPEIPDPGAAPLLRPSPAATAQKPVAPAVLSSMPAASTVSRALREIPVSSPPRREKVTSSVSEDVDLSDLEPVSAGSTAVVPLSVQIKPEEVGKVLPSALMRRALFDYGKDTNEQFVKEWADREQLAGSLPTFDIKTGKPVSTFEELEKAGSFDPATNTVTFKFNKDVLDRFRSDYEASKGTLRRLADKAYDPRVAPGELALDAARAAAVSAIEAQGKLRDVASVPLQVVDTLGNAGLQSQYNMAKRIVGLPAQSPVDIAKGLPEAVARTVTGEGAGENYQSPAATFTNEVAGDRLGAYKGAVNAVENAVFAPSNLVLGAAGKAGRAAKVAEGLDARLPSVADEGAWWMRGVEPTERVNNPLRWSDSVGVVPENIPPVQRDSLLKTATAMYKVGLLGVKTHARNVISTGTNQLLEEASRLPASIVDMVASKVTGVRSVSGVNAGAVTRSAQAAATDGVREAAQIMKTGATSNQLKAIDEVRELASGSRVIDAYVNYQFRALAAEDQVFRAYALRRSLEDRARVWAMNELKNGVLERKDFSRRVAEIVKSPSEEMSAAAIADSEVATFNNRNLINEAYRGARRGMNINALGRGVNFGLDVLFPYVRTPLNIVARTIEYTPLGAAKAGARAVAQRVLQGAFTEAEQRAFAQTIGRSVTGSTLITLGYMLAQKGRLTGANENFQDYARSVTTGRQEMSVKAGNRWFKIAGFSPIGNLLVTGATIFEQSREKGGAGAAAQAGADILLEQPFASTTKDIYKAAAEPGRNARKFAGRVVGGVVPTTVNDVGMATDEYVRDKGDSFTGQIVSRVPVLRERLPARRDALGEPVTQDRLNAINPVTSTVDRTDDPRRAAIANRRSQVSLKPITRGQRHYIWSLAGKAGVREDDLSVKLLGRRVNELSTEEAGELIEHLKAMPPKRRRASDNDR